MGNEIFNDIKVARQMIVSFIEETCSLEKTPAEIMMIYSALLSYDVELNGIYEELPDDFNEVDDADIVNNVKTITDKIKRLTK